MPLTVNLRHLEKHSVRLCGDLPLVELDFAVQDEMIRLTRPLRHDIEVELLDDSLLVRGWLRLPLHCRCVRCLKEFEFEVELDPWMLHLPLKPLEGEEAVPVKNDCVDLTLWVREDMLLEFPRHPVCKPDCGGLRKASIGKARKDAGKDESRPSAWAELNKLKL